jgi:hypothetical protein
MVLFKNIRFFFLDNLIGLILAASTVVIRCPRRMRGRGEGGINWFPFEKCIMKCSSKSWTVLEKDFISFCYHYTLFGRNLSVSCFACCLLLKQKFFPVFTQTEQFIKTQKHENIKLRTLVDSSVGRVLSFSHGGQRFESQGGHLFILLLICDMINC